MLLLLSLVQPFISILSAQKQIIQPPTAQILAT